MNLINKNWWITIIFYHFAPLQNNMNFGIFGQICEREKFEILKIPNPYVCVSDDPFFYILQVIKNTDFNNYNRFFSCFLLL